MGSLAPIVVRSPRWESIPPHAQRELSKLARTRSVLLLEEPEPVKGAREFWELKTGAPDLLICRPRVKRCNEATLERMARALFFWLDIDEFVAWPSFALDCSEGAFPSVLLEDEDDR